MFHLGMKEAKGFRNNNSRIAGIDKGGIYMAEEKKPSMHSAEVQKGLVHRLNRVEGQVRGIKKLIEQETYCDDILHQLEAARSALRSIEMVLLESHVKHCVVHQIQHGDSDVVEEILTTIKKIAK